MRVRLFHEEKRELMCTDTSQDEDRRALLMASMYRLANDVNSVCKQ